MPAAVRLGDVCTGHGCYPSRPNIAASENVFINNIGAHRVGDAWAVHCCMRCHGSHQSSGSSNVYINNVALARVGDSIACGSHNAQGSSNVFANGS